MDPMQMKLGLILKPLAAMSGVTGLTIQLDAENKQVIATGTSKGEKFTETRTFAAVEDMLNGTTPPQDSQTPPPPGESMPGPENGPQRQS